MSTGKSTRQSSAILTARRGRYLFPTSQKKSHKFRSNTTEGSSETKQLCIKIERVKNKKKQPSHAFSQLEDQVEMVRKTLRETRHRANKYKKLCSQGGEDVSSEAETLFP